MTIRHSYILGDREMVEAVCEYVEKRFPVAKDKDLYFDRSTNEVYYEEEDNDG